ncbi:hypothetical protein DTB58_33280, partial [Streptomyces griseus]|uniref:hypothetical protein n=1 Tax=Streptomyces griseus TaxID=1911 RepID=UPI001C58415D
RSRGASAPERTAGAAAGTGRGAARAAAGRAREAAAAGGRADGADGRAGDGAKGAERSHEGEYLAAASIAADPSLADRLGLPTATGVRHPRREAGDAESGPDRGTARTGEDPASAGLGGPGTAPVAPPDRAVALADPPGPAQQPLTAGEAGRSADALRRPPRRMGLLGGSGRV